MAEKNPQDETQDADGPSLELEVLRLALEQSKKQSAEYYDQLLRLKAEFENFRKRTEREKADARVWGKQDVLMPLLSLVDVFDQAIAQAKSAKDMKHVIQGLEILHKTFGGFLKSEGVEAIHAVGKKFDPHTAEAVEQVEVEDGQAGTVLGEIQKGYSLQGRMLRPSRVRVGVAKKTNGEPKDLNQP